MIRIADHETGAYQKTNEDAQERVHLVALAHTSEKHLFRQTKAVDCPHYVKHCAAGIFFIEKLVDFRKNCCNFVLGHGS